MIVLKHLSQEFDVDPYPLRMQLRKVFGKRSRWRWDEANKAELIELEKVRAHLKSWVATKKKR